MDNNQEINGELLYYRFMPVNGNEVGHVFSRGGAIVYIDKEDTPTGEGNEVIRTIKGVGVVLCSLQDAWNPYQYVQKAVGRAKSDARPQDPEDKATVKRKRKTFGIIYANGDQRAILNTVNVMYDVIAERYGHKKEIKRRKLQLVCHKVIKSPKNIQHLLDKKPKWRKIECPCGCGTVINHKFPK